MKRLLYILVVFQLLCAACFEDNSNLDIQKVNPIVIKDFGGNQLSVKQLDTLKVEPLIYCEGLPDSELSFEWKLMNYGTSVPRVLDTTMYCCAQITEKVGNGYSLRLTVTDRKTGIFRIVTYVVNITSNFSAGLLIADTRDGGVTSDLTLVKCRELTYNYNMTNEARDVVRNMWAAVNGAPLDGKILDAHLANGFSKNRSIAVVTTKGLFQADYLDYIHEWTGDELFYIKPPFTVNEIHSGGVSCRFRDRWEAMMVNGYMVGRNLQSDGKFGYVIYPNGVKDYNLSMMYLPTNKSKTYPVYAYDALGKRMLFFNGVGWRAKDEQTGPFNVNDLSGYEPLFLGESSAGMNLLVKNRTTNALQVLNMKLTEAVNVSEETKFAKAVYDLSGALNIGQAQYYAMSRLEGNVLCYATETEVYAGSMENNMGYAGLQWTAEPGETITGIQFYTYDLSATSDQAGGSHYYGGVDGKDVSQLSVDRLLLIATQNAAGEGKVTAVPMVDQHTGRLEQNKKYHLIFDGFGKILGFYKQL